MNPNEPVVAKKDTRRVVYVDGVKYFAVQLVGCPWGGHEVLTRGDDVVVTRSHYVRGERDLYYYQRDAA